MHTTKAALTSWEKLSLKITPPVRGSVAFSVFSESRFGETFLDDLCFTTQEVARVVQENHYYPFGMNLKGVEREPSGFHKFQFQGQEKNEELGLHWASFKWRNADVQTGRFFSVDPLAEKFYYNSTFAFSENKVVSHIELEGLEAISSHDVNVIEGFKQLGEQITSSSEWIGLAETLGLGETIEVLEEGVLSTKFEAKLTIGPQAGASIETPFGEVGGEVKLAALELAAYEYEQQVSDTGPEKESFTTIFTNNGTAKIEQGASLSLGIASGEIGQSFIANLENGGYTDLKTKAGGKVGIGPLSIGTETEESSSTSQAGTKAGGALGFSGAFGLGFEVKIWHGKTDESIQKQ